MLFYDKRYYFLAPNSADRKTNIAGWRLLLFTVCIYKNWRENNFPHLHFTPRTNKKSQVCAQMGQEEMRTSLSSSPKARLPSVSGRTNFDDKNLG